MATQEDGPRQQTLGLFPDPEPVLLTERALSRRNAFESTVVKVFGKKPNLFHRGVTNVERIMNAYDDAEFAHRLSPLRASGDDYITHPLGAAYLLIEQCGLKGNLGADLVIAVLLHDVLEDTDAIVPKELVHAMGSSAWRERAFQKLAPRYGKHVANITLAVSKPVVEGMDIESKEEANTEAAKAIKDPDTAVVKMADRTHNLQTIRFTSAQKQNRIIKETIEIYREIFKKAKSKYPKAYEVLSLLIDSSIVTAARELEANGNLDPEVKALIEAKISIQNQE